MNDNLLDSCGQQSSGSTATAEVPPAFLSEDAQAAWVESVVFPRLQKKLEEFKAFLVASIGVTMGTQMESVIEAKVKSLLSSLPAPENSGEKTREVLTGVLASTLFESGLLEKTVTRIVEQKGLSAGGGAPADLSRVVREECTSLIKQLLAEGSGSLRHEIQALARKEITAALGGEEFKVLLDDKFRAISLYLKTELIPKTVAQALKGTKP
jgi:phage tail tube protein FII